MKEFRAFRSVLLVAVLLLTACHRTDNASKAADLCDCGPDFCLNDPRHPPKLAQKKTTLRAQGFPDNLVALLDRDGQCVAAVDRGPDTFTILLVKANGDNSTTPWTQQDEDLAKREILDGTIKEYYKHNARKIFACCKEKKAEERADWDPQLSLSKNLSIKCSKQGSTVVCN